MAGIAPFLLLLLLASVTGQDEPWTMTPWADGTETTEPTEPTEVTEVTESTDGTESTEGWWTTTVAPERDTIYHNLRYCAAELCLRYDRTGTPYQARHVACGYDGTFAADCPAGRTQYRVDQQLQGLIVELHNEARDRLARGMLPGFEPAVRMPTMVWDEELADLAAVNVRSCRFAHDECRSTDRYRQAGQNLATGTYTLETDMVEIVRKLTALWYEEYRDADQDALDQYPTDYNATIGHFTQMVSDRTTALGCSLVIYPSKLEDFTVKVALYACNYGLTNINGQPVYRRGTTAGARCTFGINPQYGGLCRVEENVAIKSVPYYE